MIGRRQRLLLVALIALLSQFAGTLPAHAAVPQSGGVTLDGWGGVHAFGGAQVNTANSAYWGGWDIARGTTVREDGSGGWTLDGWGGIHAWGAAAVISTPFFASGWDISRDMVVTSRDAGGLVDGRQGYLLDGWGGLHAWGGAPSLSGPYPGVDVARGLAIHTSASGVPDGGWTLFKDGSIHSFGAAPALPISLPNDNVFQKVHTVANGAGGYVVARWGVTTLFGSGVSPYWNGYGDWGTWDIVRDVVLLNPTNPAAQTQPSSAAAADRYRATTLPHGGVTLDGFGGLHSFGGIALNAANAPYWSGWSIARSVAVRDDGSGGWTLDGWGGIHAFGAAPAIATPAFWSGWDIARAIAVTTPDGAQGYLLDGWGTVHPWGGAPAICGGTPWWGFDRARGLAIHYGAGHSPDGCWIMDNLGGVHAMGNAPWIGAPAYSGRPGWHSLHPLAAGAYAVGVDGAVMPLGSIDSPYWESYGDFGSWDIIRDIALVNPVDPEPGRQPISGAAWGGFAGSLSGRYGAPAGLYQQQRALDCEAAALQQALAGRGTYVSQDWILAVMGADTRRALRDSFGNIIRWGNPYQTFVGDVNAAQWNGTGYGVYYPPIQNAARAAGHNARGAEGWSPADVYGYVASGYAAVVWVSVGLGYQAPRWWTSWDGQPIRWIFGEHAMTMVGVDYGRGTVVLYDDEFAIVREVSMGAFEASFSYLNNMAVVVG